MKKMSRRQVVAHVKELMPDIFGGNFSHVTVYDWEKATKKKEAQAKIKADAAAAAKEKANAVEKEARAAALANVVAVR